MQTLTQGDLQIESAIPIAAIVDFRMKVHANAHIYAQIEGIVSDEDGEACFLQPMAETKITVRADNRILFAGMLREAQIKQEGQGYQVFLTGVSYTEQLDYQKKRRTFQDASMTYQEVIQQILTDMPGARMQFRVGDREIGTPLYQMEETDWEFIKRMAGRLHTGIVAYAYATMPDIDIGIPKGEEHRAKDKVVREKVWYDRERRSYCVYVRTGEDWEIGDRVECEDGVLTVTEKECRLEQGLLYFHYTLAQKAYIKACTVENPYAPGLLLSGTVLNVQEEKVKVRFDVDKEQPLESAYWYPWEPDMGNLTYCMPEKGGACLCTDWRCGRICGKSRVRPPRKRNR